MKIIGWVVTRRVKTGFYGIVPLSWAPVFADPRPQLIIDPMSPQRRGVVRRARLCSSPVPMEPYQ